MKLCAVAGALVSLMGLSMCVALLANYKDMAGALSRANIDAMKTRGI